VIDSDVVTEKDRQGGSRFVGSPDGTRGVSHWCAVLSPLYIADLEVVCQRDLEYFVCFMS